MSNQERPPSASTQSLVFSRDEGKPCKFFVEASAVRERPKLIRAINKNGGLVVNTAREADILLAESNTKEALELFEAWCGDKIVLSTRWVTRCLEVNAFLGTDNKWAGYELTREVLSESLDIQDNESEAEEEEEETVEGELLSKSASHPASKLPPNPPTKPTQQPKLGTAPPLTAVKPPKQMRRIRSLAASPVELGPYVDASASKPIPGTHPPARYPHRTTQPPRPSLTNNNPSPHLLPQASQPILHPPQPPQPPQPHPPPQQQAWPQPAFNNPVPQQQPHLQGFYSFFRHNPSSSPYTSIPNPSPQQHYAQQPNLDVLPKIRTFLGTQYYPIPVNAGQSQTPEAASTHLTRDDEVQRPTRSRKRRRPVTMIGSSEDDEIQKAIRSNPPRPKEVPIPKSGMFVDGHGQSKQFYIMVDIKNRKDLLKIVRKHGGIIVSQMEVADYVILNHRSNQFQKALTILPAAKVVLAPAWLEECGATGKVVDMAPHVIDVTFGGGKGMTARQKSITKSPQRKGGDVGEGNEPDSSQQPTLSNPSLIMSPIKTQEGGSSSPHMFSRSPSPPTQPPAMTDGKYAFTEEDRQWFLKYARFKLRLNPELSFASLMRMLSVKAPHHSAKSWDKRCRNKWIDEFNTLKEEATVFHRQMQSGLPPSAPSTPTRGPIELLYPEASSPIVSPSNGAPPSSSAPTTEMSSQMCLSPTPAGALKRKEGPDEDRTESNRQEKRIKGAGPEDSLLDGDAFPSIWLMSP